MQQYTVQLYDDDAIVIDENNQDVSPDDVRKIISHLKNVYDELIPTKLYLMYSPRMRLHKIGISNNPNQRLNNLKIQYYDKNMEIIHVTKPFHRREAEEKELLLHKLFSHCHVATFGEHGLGKEWFQLEQKDINLFRNEKLFLEYSGCVVIHPLLLLRYVCENDLLSEQIQKILIMSSEIVFGVKEPFTKDTL
jgi:hypothetical protein